MKDSQDFIQYDEESHNVSILVLFSFRSHQPAPICVVSLSRQMALNGHCVFVLYV